MSAKPYNEPAFPVTAEQSPSGAFPTAGMTLRDYFAAMAMQGLCANPGGPFQANPMSGWGLTNCGLGNVAGTAYGMADAMLEQRGKQ